MSKKTLHKKNEIENQVMSKISSGNLHMQTKAHFVVLGIVSIIAIILMVFLSTYFISVSSLFIRLQIAQGPAYGIQRNLGSLVQTFPWWAMILGILFITASVKLVAKTGNMYKVRLRHLALIVVAIVLCVGFVFSYSSFPNFGNRNINRAIPSVRGYHFSK